MARSTLIQTARLIAIGLLLGSVANAAVVQVGDYGLGEPGTVGPEADYFVPLVDSSTANDGAANNITYFQGGGSGWNVDLVTSGLAAPGSTAALELVQGGSGNSGWATTVPSYGLADNWVAQLWFKTPTDTSTGDSKVFFGSDDNNAELHGISERTRSSLLRHSAGLCLVAHRYVRPDLPHISHSRYDRS